MSSHLHAAGPHRGSPRCIRLVAVALFVAATLSAPLASQTPGTVVGVVAGWVSNQGVWRPEGESARVGGVLVGGFALAPTPLPWLAVQAQASYTQRGADVAGSVVGDPADSGVRADYVTFSVAPRLSLPVGPVALFVNAGPSIEQLVRSRESASLAPALQERSTVFGVHAGMGVGVRTSRGARAEIEVRIFEGLGDAYSGSFRSVRNRSIEFLGRLGAPLRR